MNHIEIIKNKKIKLEIPQFVCDNNPIGEHLNKYPMLSHLNNYGFNLIIGKPGSGKTSLMISFLSNKGKDKILKKCFNNILVVMPSSSIQSMKKNIFKDHDLDKMYDELTEFTITDIYNKLKLYSEDNENTLLIMDDVNASLKDNEIQKILKTIIYNRRHLKVQIIMLAQSFIGIPKEIRKLTTNCIMFKPSKVEMINFLNELFETKKEYVLELLQLYKNKGDYLWLNLESQKIYKNFDEIIIHEK